MFLYMMYVDVSNSCAHFQYSFVRNKINALSTASKLSNPTTGLTLPQVDELHSYLAEACPSHRKGAAEEGGESSSAGGHWERHRWSEGDRRSRLWTERGEEMPGGEDIYGDHQELRSHCRQLSDSFLRCFVSGQWCSSFPIRGRHSAGP